MHRSSVCSTARFRALLFVTREPERPCKIIASGLQLTARVFVCKIFAYTSVMCIRAFTCAGRAALLLG